MKPGLQILLDSPPAFLRGAKIGLAAHAASVTLDGTPAWQALAQTLPGHLRAVFSPEHGLFSKAGAGEKVTNGTLPGLNIPLFSLYGETRTPSSDMLKNIDWIVVDFQDLAVRCYTYVSTLDNILQAASRHDIGIVVTDRPAPLAGTVDGPLLEEDFSSFVGQIPAPLVYGMTPAETARWLKTKRGYTCPLEVVPIQDFHRFEQPDSNWPNWVPPSPAIRSWQTALTYPALVICEALPQLNVHRSTPEAFRVAGLEGFTSDELADQLAATGLNGFQTRATPQGAAIEVTSLQLFCPAALAVHLAAILQRRHGIEKTWHCPGARESFFDQLLGTDKVRRSLKAGTPPAEIIQSWGDGHRNFAEERGPFLLYPAHAKNMP